MQEFQFFKMSDFSVEQINQIQMLEQLCKEFDRSSLRVGTDCLKEVGGDHAFLCRMDDQFVGFLSWHTIDAIEANINAMVHPDYRRRGILSRLAKLAAEEIKAQGIQACRIRVPSNSRPGVACVEHLGAQYNQSEFTMNLARFQAEAMKATNLILRPEEPQDFDFMVKCFSQAFGDSESWTIQYFQNTRDPECDTYIACDGLTPVGMVRVMHLQSGTAAIHAFCVLPSYQGRGYGREILARVVSILLDKPCAQVRLSVVTQNQRALGLYQSVGFEIFAENLYYVGGIEVIGGG